MTGNAIAREIVDGAYRIHTTLGPGLLESVYQTVLAYELGRRRLRTVSQQPIPVVYEDVHIDTGFGAESGGGRHRSPLRKFGSLPASTGPEAVMAFLAS